MLAAEARWFAARLREIGDAAYPMLNIGSHTEEFRQREQPWIDRYLFAPAREKGLKVVHSDIRSAPGVDLVGDLTDPAFLAHVGSMQFRSAFCANLLEHVTNREEIARCVAAAVVPGGYLLVSCPHVFPYHPDPIDTLFRPSPAELATLFPGTELVHGETVTCGTLATYLLARVLAQPSMFARTLARRRQQVVRTTETGLSAWQWLPWLLRTFVTTCVVLRKPLERPPSP